MSGNSFYNFNPQMYTVILFRNIREGVEVYAAALYLYAACPVHIRIGDIHDNINIFLLFLMINHIFLPNYLTNRKRIATFVYKLFQQNGKD